MCGICGIISAPPHASLQATGADALVRGMMHALRHRGPDDEGCVIRGEAGSGRPVAALGCRRLAVIAPHRARQPMCNEDATVWTVFNGAVYNYHELRRQLADSGHVLQTEGDTACLVHLYEDSGADCVQRLRGMFALALWDERIRTLILARDRLGQKPLFYTFDERRGLFAFASELKALLTLPMLRRDVSPEAVASYLAHQYVPHPLCIVRNVKKLPPAHVLLYRPDDRQVRVSPYWRLPSDCEESMDGAEAQQRLRATIREAVRLRMSADVPVGAFLSGGIDSALTVAMMSASDRKPVRTFTVGFGDPRFDERRPAARVAAHYHAQHRSAVLGPETLALLPDIAWYADEPFGDSSALPTFCVSRLAASDVKVVLTGDGGDECFAGYSRYRAAWLARPYDMLSRRVPLVWRLAEMLAQAPPPGPQSALLRDLHRFAAALPLSPEQRYVQWMSIFSPEALGRLLTPDFLTVLHDAAPHRFLPQCYAALPGEDVVHRTALVDMLSYLPCDILTKVDRMTMAHGVESRSPFLDHKVVELAASIPMRHKIGFTMRGPVGKHILKKAFARDLPRHVLKGKKRGFGVPVASWLRREGRSLLGDVLLSGRSLQRGYMRPEEVRRLVGEHLQGTGDHAHRLWSLLMLELWHDRFVDGRRRVRRHAGPWTGQRHGFGL